MTGSWSPCRTEAKARKALQGIQQSAESEKMGGMRGEDPKKGCTELPATAETQILHWKKAHAASGSLLLQRPGHEKGYMT